MTAHSTLHLDSVWLSTEAQFQAFDEAFADASWLAKHVGRYRIPPSAAYTQSILMPWMRMPITIVAAGKLYIDESDIVFAPFQRNSFGWARRNMRTDLAFNINKVQLTMVEAYDRHSPVNSRYDTHWTRIRTARPAPLDNFFLSIGGRNRMALSRYQEQSLQLRRFLQGLLDS